MDDISLGPDDAPPKRGGASLLVFALGILIGAAGTFLVPRYLGQYLPDGLRGGSEMIEGPVLGKRQEDDRLLLTVQAAQGAALATFRERVAEIDLLVDVGDTVTLGVPRYEPFIEDPAFIGIRKVVPKAPETPAQQGAGAESLPRGEGGPASADPTASEDPADSEESAPPGDRGTPGDTTTGGVFDELIEREPDAGDESAEPEQDGGAAAYRP